MGTTTSSLAEHYRSVRNDDLLRIWGDYTSLTPEALTSLSTELSNRHLITKQEADAAIAHYRQSAEEVTRGSKDNKLDRAERLAIAISISLGFWILCVFVAYMEGGTSAAIQVSPFSGQWPRFGFVIGLLSGLIRPNWLTRWRLALIVVVANVLWIIWLVKAPS